jgi:uncharacterized protein (DUF305 family)
MPLQNPQTQEKTAMNATTTSRLGRLVGAGFIAATLALASCSTGSDSSTSSAEPSSTTPAPVDKVHNAADVSFSQDMLVHHQGAIQMARMAEEQASTQQVKDLVKRIEAAQGPEIDEMTSWLKAWGEPVSPSNTTGNMDHSSGSKGSGSMGSGAMGMMTNEQMNQLMGAQGASFDRMFLEMMTTHHQGAIEMAKIEQTDGSSPQAIALAKSIETSQTAEVAEMAQMLKSL